MKRGKFKELAKTCGNISKKEISNKLVLDANLPKLKSRSDLEIHVYQLPSRGRGRKTIVSWRKDPSKSRTYPR